jgi:NADH-quinone oxidoreductase E subunit
MTQTQTLPTIDEDASPVPGDILEFARECAARERARSYLIPVLHRLQTKVGYLKKSHLAEIAAVFKVPVSSVMGVATFYHYFTLQPRGRTAVSVCTGTACHVRGAGAILERCEQLLGIKFGETTPDGAFSIEQARCLGMCALAPVVLVGGKVYGNVTSAQLEKILQEHGYRGQGNA